MKLLKGGRRETLGAARLARPAPRVAKHGGEAVDILSPCVEVEEKQRGDLQANQRESRNQTIKVSSLESRRVGRSRPTNQT